MDRIQKMGLISGIVFGIIITLELIAYFTDNTNRLIITQYLQFSVISAGFVGLIYAIFALKSLDKTEDNIKVDIEKLTREEGIYLDSNKNVDR